MNDDYKKLPAIQNRLISAAVEIDQDDPLARIGIEAKPRARRRRPRAIEKPLILLELGNPIL
jgi:hypothetical protein